jgi:hypothetical protein
MVPGRPSITVESTPRSPLVKLAAMHWRREVNAALRFQIFWEPINCSTLRSGNCAFVAPLSIMFSGDGRAIPNAKPIRIPTANHNPTWAIMTRERPTHTRIEGERRAHFSPWESKPSRCCLAITVLKIGGHALVRALYRAQKAVRTLPILLALISSRTAVLMQET